MICTPCYYTLLELSQQEIEIGWECGSYGKIS
jgi:hypothetical protein